MSNKIQTIDFMDNNAGEQLSESLHNTGFGLLYNHPIDSNLITGVSNDWEAFFCSKEKYSFTFNPKTQDGYFPYRSENAKGYSAKDLKEFYNYYEWGQYPNNISENTKRLYYELLSIGQILLIWINENMPALKASIPSLPLPEMIKNSPMNLMRIIHYPPLRIDGANGALRAAPHSDINLITVLPASSQSGLQIQSKQDKWLDIECDPRWLVINTGDMLQEHSGGYYPSTIHRVNNPIDKYTHLSRYSMPLFIHPRDEVILSKRYSAKKYLDERLREIGLKK